MLPANRIAIQSQREAGRRQVISRRRAVLGCARTGLVEMPGEARSGCVAQRSTEAARANCCATYPRPLGSALSSPASRPDGEAFRETFRSVERGAGQPRHVTCVPKPYVRGSPRPLFGSRSGTNRLRAGSMPKILRGAARNRTTIRDYLGGCRSPRFPTHAVAATSRRGW